MQQTTDVSVTIENSDWHDVNWRKANRIVRQLRQRIFKATQNGDIKKVRSLQRLMLRSYSNVLISVRRATQDNKGRNTAGVDKVLVETGTPQGGIISPLLANIALNGLEKHIGVKYNNRGESTGERILVRYADDFVILCESKDDALKAQEITEEWLKTRGLELSKEKTKIVHISEGFDFLGFNIRHYKVNNTKTGYKLLIKPSLKFVKNARSKIREVFLRRTGQSVGILISEINPIIRGIAEYCRKVVSSEIFGGLDDYLFTRQKRYAKRTHPNKSNKWKAGKYWGRLNLSRNGNWDFGDKSTGGYMLKFSWFNIERHPMVSKSSSPDDPELRDYWKKRSTTRDKSEATKYNKLKEKVAQRQEYRCKVCGESIFNEEPIDLHHIIPRSEGGKDEIKNLIWVHRYCHHKIHHQK